MKADRRQFDPLSFIPSPAAVRRRLDETRALAAKLEILLDVATRLSDAGTLPDPPRNDQSQGVARA
jgi:hypothetical protein